MINFQNKGGCTALSSAKDAKETKLLLDVGADPNIQNEDGYTALMEANNAEQTKLLLDAGADPNIQMNNGYKAVHGVINLLQLKLLIEYGADPESKDGLEDTILDISREKHNTEIVNFCREELGMIPKID